VSSPTSPGSPPQDSAAQFTVCPQCSAVYPEPRRVCERCRYWATSSSWTAGGSSAREHRRLPYFRFGMLWAIAVPFLFLGILAPRAYFSVFNSRLLVASPSGDSASSPGPGEWTMEGRDLTHSRFVPEAAPLLQGKIKWKADLGEPTGSAPVVAGGTVYIGGGDFKVYALAADSGALRWTFPTTGPVHSQPTVAGDLVYVGLLDGRVVALDRATGAQRWQFQTGNPIYRSFSVRGGRVYFGSGDKVLYALDAASGRRLWSFPTEGWVRSTPAVSEGRLYFTSDDQSIYFVDARSGRQLLRFRTGRALGTSPVVAGAKVYQVARDGRLFVLDGKTHDFPLEYQFRVFWGQMFIWGLAPFPTPYSGSKWTYANVRDIEAPAAVAGDLIVVASAKGAIYGLAASANERRWEYQAGRAIRQAPLVVGDLVIAVDEAGAIHGVDAGNGSGRFIHRLGVPLAAAPVYANGVLYLRGTDGSLYAIQ